MKKILITHSKGGVGKTLLAASFADVLPNTALVDLDPQQSLALGMELTKKRGVYKNLSDVSPGLDFVVIDTPPYRTRDTEGLLDEADFVLIPCSDGFTDLFAANRTAEVLRSKNALHKSFFVFSRVRQPLNNTVKEIRTAFSSNFPDVQILKNVISQRVAFQRIFTDYLEGQAKREVEAVLQEMKIRY